MPTPPRNFVKSDFIPGRYAYGFSIPALSYYGEFRPYGQNSIYGMDAYSTQVIGLDLLDRFGDFFIHKLPLASLRTSGQFAGRIVYYCINGRQLKQTYSVYRASPKAHLASWSDKFAQGATAYHALSAPGLAQLRLDAAARHPPATGYNYFLSLFMKDDPRLALYV